MNALEQAQALLEVMTVKKLVVDPHGWTKVTVSQMYKGKWYDLTKVFRNDYFLNHHHLLSSIIEGMDMELLQGAGFVLPTREWTARPSW